MKFEELYKSLLEAEIDLLELNSGERVSTNLKEQLETISTFIFNQSLKVFQASKEENLFWSHCTIAIYNSTYEDRLKQALDNDNNKIHNELEFVESEIGWLINLKMNFSNSNYHPDLFNPIEKKIRLLEFKKYQLLPDKKEELLDFDDSSAMEKVIYLHKLGVLDFLRKQTAFNNSTNNLAKFLSAVTGENSRTLQSYLNPIYSIQVDQKNNPLSKKTSVERIEKQLNLMGISV
ncbi:hypothetical protein L1S35_06510 [Flavobacterium sp. AS60]|uniref:hypothetical protein n=1 Tax=Flavobacterium anseongense TaxID=2910677 RepID=UPI001F19DAB8|nr:hypothetical protein [Flavobacterium sp. AS60]MCF6129318.1 hypothetical protein [Flavobacterium sp. AS60]